MKQNIITFIIAVVVLVLILIFYKPGLNISQVPRTVTTCFLQSIDTQFGKDYTFIQTTLSANGMASGTFNILPAEKDSLTGRFVGTWKNETDTSVILDVMQNQREQRLFRMDANSISIGWNGNYTQTIPKVACVQVPEEAKNPSIKPSATQLPPVTFVCSKKEEFTLKFIGVDKVELTSPGKGGISLNHVLSASGARYANADESIVAWNKGNTLMIIENGKTTHSNCIVR